MFTQAQIIAGFSNSQQAADFRQNLQQKVADAEFGKLSAERRAALLESRASLIDAQTSAVIAEIASYDAVIPNVSGALLVDMQNRKTRAEYRLFTLEQRAANSGKAAVFELKVRIEDLNTQIAAYNLLDGAIFDVIALVPPEWN